MDHDPISDALIAPEPRQIDASFLAAAGYLARYGPGTRRAYETDLRDWWHWCGEHGLAVLEVKRPHLELFTRHLTEERGLAAGTVAKRLSVLIGYYRFAHLDGFIEADPAAHVRRPRVPKTGPTRPWLDRNELGAFLVAAGISGGTDHALAALLALNGLRVSEALGARIENLGIDRGHRTMQIIGKGGVPAVIPLAPRTAVAIDLSLDGRTSGPIFLSGTGAPMDRHAATRVVRRLARRAGITKPISPHSLRHSFITAALDAGCTMRDVQEAARHADPRMTAWYDRSRGSLDRHSTYVVAAYVAGAT